MNNMYNRKYSVPSFFVDEANSLSNTSNCGCNKTDDDFVSISSINDLNLKSKVVEWGENNLNPGLIGIDYDRMCRISIGKSTIIFARHIGASIKDNISFGFVFNEIDGQIRTSLIISAEKISDNLMEVKVFNSKNKLLFSASLKNNNKSIVVENHNVYLASGQNTLDCFIDAYSNHGWASIGLTIMSIVEPWGGVIVMAACAGRNRLN